MSSTIIQQGRFISDGSAEKLEIRSDVDWMEVINETQFATTQTPGRGVKFEWQRGLAVGHGFEYAKSDGANALQAEKITSGGFTLITGAASAPVSGTTITKASPPVCTAAGHGFSNGDKVELSKLTNMPQISGAIIVFSIGNVTTNTFELTYFNTNTPNFTAETAFTVRTIPAFTWQGSWSIISSVITGNTTQVQFSTNEPEEIYSPGTVLTFTVPSEYGMTELSDQQAEILSYNSTTNTYTLALDSSSFSAFSWPASSAIPLGVPTARVVGSATNSSLDAVTNIDSLQIKLGAGIDGPAGSSGDVIYWKAGKSFSITNE